MHGFTGAIACWFDLLFEFGIGRICFFPPLTNNDYGYSHHWLVHEGGWCNFERLLSRGIGHRNLFWQYFPSNSMVFTCIDILYNHIHQVDGSKWHAAFERTLQNVRQTCLSTNTMCLYMLIRSALTKSDTNGGYRQFLGWAVVVNRLNRLWTKDRKRALLRLFRPCTLPKCSSTTPMYHVQPTTTIHWD